MPIQLPLSISLDHHVLKSFLLLGGEDVTAERKIWSWIEDKNRNILKVHSSIDCLKDVSENLARLSTLPVLPNPGDYHRWSSDDIGKMSKLLDESIIIPRVSPMSILEIHEVYDCKKLVTRNVGLIKKYDFAITPEDFVKFMERHI